MLRKLLRFFRPNPPALSAEDHRLATQALTGDLSSIWVPHIGDIVGVSYPDGGISMVPAKVEHLCDRHVVVTHDGARKKLEKPYIFPWPEDHISSQTLIKK